MARRKGAEFNNLTREHVHRRSESSCERCGAQEEDLELHHRLALWFAAEYFPQLSSHILSSVANSEMLCRPCHKAHHRKDRWGRNNKHYEEIGKGLEAMDTMRLF